MSEFKVEIGADIKELNSKLKQASNDIKNFSKNTDVNLNKFSKSTKTASKSLSSLQKGTVNGSAAMTSFSRTIQDAPFGIMGVSNNITNLTEQFGHLKNKTGSASGALKAMLRDLKGFGGITLAISALTSVLLVYGDEIEALFDSTSKLTKENKALTESTKGLIGGVQKEISTLNVLLNVARDETLSKTKRLNAVKKINQLFPDYLGNLKLEGVNSETTANQVDMLTKSLVRQATVKGLLNRISEVAAKKFEAEQKAAKEYVSFTDKVGSAFSFLFSTNEKYTTAFGKGSKKRTEAIKEEEKKIESLQTTISNILKNNEIDFDSLFGGKGKVDTKFVGERVKTIGENLNQSYIDVIAKFNETKLQYPLTITGSETFTKFDRDAAIMKAKMLILSENIRSIVQNQLQDAFMGIGNAIGNAMSGANSLANGLGSALLGSMGGLLTQLGQMAIKVGVSLKAIKLALKSLNPAVAIGAGVSLIALGSAFSNQSNKLGNSIGGSSGSSNAGGSTSSGGSSFSSGGNFSSNGGTVVFEIAGTKLVGVLSNTLQRNKNLGGSFKII